jgi:predicted RNA-binding Zn-ribbon protein involved in translation (DUF1610 family)/DNA-binding transcriptional MerR regulator
MGLLDIFQKKETTEAESEITKVQSSQEQPSAIDIAISEVEREEMEKAANRIADIQEQAEEKSRLFAERLLKVEAQIKQIEEGYANSLLSDANSKEKEYEQAIKKRDAMLAIIQAKTISKDKPEPTIVNKILTTQSEPTPQETSKQNPCPSCGDELKGNRCWSCGYTN